MKYLLLVCWDAERMNGQTEPEPGAAPVEDEEPFPWVDDLRARGIWLTGDQLAPPRRARTVRVRAGKKMVTDGPFAETKEAVGGFDLIECEDPKALAAYVAFRKTTLRNATRLRDEFFAKSALDPNSVTGMDGLMTEAVNLKYMPRPLTPAEVAEFVQVPLK